MPIPVEIDWEKFSANIHVREDILGLLLKSAGRVLKINSGLEWVMVFRWPNDLERKVQSAVFVEIPCGKGVGKLLLGSIGEELALGILGQGMSWFDPEAVAQISTA